MLAYTSSALSSAETCYVQIEKELLAVVLSFAKFHQFVIVKMSLLNQLTTNHWKLSIKIAGHSTTKITENVTVVAKVCTHLHFITNQAKK